MRCIQLKGQSLLKLAALCASFWASTSYAEIVVVVHPSNAAAIDRAFIEKVYLGKVKAFGSGSSVEPVNLKNGAALRSQFNELVMGRNDAQINAYWSKLVFTGKAVLPKEVDSEAAVIAEVAKNTNAIGYVSASAVSADVKVIATFN